MIKFKRGETIFAFELITRDILPYALEHGTKLFKLRVLFLLAKVSIQLAAQLPNAQIGEEEERKADDSVTDYKSGCLTTAFNLLS
jgi:hypothetical protein